MIRRFSIGKVIFPLAIATMIGCQPSAEEVVETPAPPPPPMDDWFRMTELTIGTEDEGVDVDGDGSVDNNIEAALTEISDQIYAAVETALITAGIPAGEECTAQPPCVDTIMALVDDILDTALSVESLSAALNQPIQEGTINYLMEFLEAGAGVDLNWFQGEFIETGIAATLVLGKQAGSIDATGSGSFGPGSLTLIYEPPSSANSDADPDPIPITLYNGRTLVTGYNAERLNDFVTGGAVSIEDLLELTVDTINTVNEQLPAGAQLDDEQIDQIVEAVSVALLAQADVSIDSDAELEGFSIGLIATSTHIVPVE